MRLCYNYTEWVGFISSEGHISKCQLTLLIGSRNLSVTEFYVVLNVFWPRWTCKKPQTETGLWQEVL